MSKVKSNSNTKFIVLIIIGFILFAVTCYSLASTEYVDLLTSRLKDLIIPQGILYALIASAFFMPSGALIAYSYVVNYFDRYLITRTIALTFLMSVAMAVIFFWYNLFINLGN